MSDEQKQRDVPTSAGEESPSDATVSERGAVVAALAPSSARVGHDTLEQGGNAIDAAVAAALCAAVVEPDSCGMAGYGAHLTIALANGQVTCIDANSAAPQAARPDMFGVNAGGQVRGEANYYGWLAAGIPGTLAGLQLALDQYGTKKFGDVVVQAIRFARDGFRVDERMAGRIAQFADHLKRDPTSKQIYFNGDRPLEVGDLCRNSELASLLEQLAERGSVESFYRGDIGRQIAAEYQKYGGIATAEDFAAYEAKEVEPVVVEWGNNSIQTAPLTAGGISTLQALSILRALDWKQLGDDHQKNHAVLEALRLAWRDRLRYFGDPEHVDVPTGRLLSDGYAEQLAREVRQAVTERRPVEFQLDSYEQIGTVHISAGDASGNLVALTLTHGRGFGACVTVKGTGLTLGHGVSRFDPRPGFANSVGPGKRPLNNMAPTVVLRDGRPVLAVGGRGGRRILNALCSTLLPFIASDQSMGQSIDAPRLHTEGGLTLMLDDLWRQEDVAYFNKLGYEVTRAQIAHLSAVSFDHDRSRVRAALR